MLARVVVSTEASLPDYGQYPQKLHPSQYDNVRVYAQVYEEMIYALDDLIAAQGCWN